MFVGIQDKVLADWLKDKQYIGASDEGEAMAIGAGHYIQTGERATVFMSADGFCNTLNALTSWIIPDEIEMNIVISTGRQEPPHKVMSDILPDLIAILPYDSNRIHITIIEKQP